VKPEVPYSPTGLAQARQPVLRHTALGCWGCLFLQNDPAVDRGSSPTRREARSWGLVMCRDGEYDVHAHYRRQLYARGAPHDRRYVFTEHDTEHARTMRAPCAERCDCGRRLRAEFHGTAHGGIAALRAAAHGRI